MRKYIGFDLYTADASIVCGFRILYADSANHIQSRINCSSIDVFFRINEIIPGKGWKSTDSGNLYLLITINTVIHWRTNNDKCFLTTYVNKKFGIKETNTFRSIFYVCGVKATGYFFITLWIIFGCCVCIYKLFINKNKKNRDKDMKSRRLLRQSD